jgi:DNA-binding response OmpR family regulator
VAKPDLVILDFMMPVRDGISAGREIRTLCPETPIMLFTLHASPSLAIQAKSIGFEAVVGKTDTALIEVIRRVLQSRAGVRTSEGKPAAKIPSGAQPQPGTGGSPAKRAGRSDPVPGPEAHNARSVRMFNSGDLVPKNGLYAVTHSSHRLPQEVALLRGQRFPGCSHCSAAVGFQVLKGRKPRRGSKMSVGVLRASVDG